MHLRDSWLTLAVGLLLSPTALAFGADGLTIDPDVDLRIEPKGIEAAVEAFEVRSGFEVEPIATEPEVVDPIAMAFDADGRLYVVEMRGYSERRDEHLGRIRLLEDQDRDGVYETGHIFAKNLSWPTGVVCYDGGIFVAATPDLLYLKDRDGDHAADQRRAVFTGFGNERSRLNVQGLFNSLRWGFDNRIHGATSHNGGEITSPVHPDRPGLRLGRRDFSFDPRDLTIRPESGGGQYGLAFDDGGRKYVCRNSHHIQMIVYEARYADINPYYNLPPARIDIPADGPAAEIFRISPDEPWRVIRTRWRVAGKVGGPVEGGGRPSGYFTAATGIQIYRGDAWPERYRGDAFIADCGSNLIHRKRLDPNGAEFLATRPKSGRESELVASEDIWFRPVQLENGPDGNLYAIDMYREVIEHPWSLPPPIKKRLDLNSGNDRGRIYRIRPSRSKGRPQRRSVALSDAPTGKLVELLTHANGWHRQTASRLIYEREDRSVAAELRQQVKQAESGVGRLHSLYALAGLDALDQECLILALRDPDERVREKAIRLSERFILNEGASEKLFDTLAGMTDDAEARVRFQLGLTLGMIEHPQTVTCLVELIGRNSRHDWVAHAALNAATEKAGPLLARLAEESSSSSVFRRETWIIEALAEVIGRRNNSEEINQVLERMTRPSDSVRSLRVASAVAEGLEAAGTTLSQAASKSSWQSLYERAATVAREADSTEARQVAVRFLGKMPLSEVETALLALLKPDLPHAVQAEALDALGGFVELGISEAVLQRWASLTPRLRSMAIDILLKRRERARALAQALREGTVNPGELAASQREALRQFDDQAIQEAVQAIFGDGAGASASRFEAYDQVLKLKGEPSAGKRIYDQRCAVCHGGEGSPARVGPELATVKASGRGFILSNLLEPNREVAPEYLNYRVERKSGEILNGIIENETGESLTLRQANGETVTIDRAKIKTLKSTGGSIMPRGLEQGLSAQDLADLLAYIMEAEK